jgi:hypothetical protein
MNPILQPIHGQSDAGQLIHAMLAQESLEAENTKRVISEIELRATKVGSVLEGILHEAHGSTRWGLNE